MAQRTGECRRGFAAGPEPGSAGGWGVRRRGAGGRRTGRWRAREGTAHRREADGQRIGRRDIGGRCLGRWPLRRAGLVSVSLALVLAVSSAPVPGLPIGAHATGGAHAADGVHAEGGAYAAGGAHVTAGAPGSAASARRGPSTLRVALTQEIDTLNPFLAFYLSSTTVLRLAYDQLTNYDPKTLRPRPGLATKWQVSRNRRTWTYTIRNNAKWSDGKPVTARDIAFTYNLMLRDPDARTANGGYVTPFASVKAPNDRTLVITTKRPSATMLSIAVPIVPEHVWSRVKKAGRHEVTTFPVVGSGPFTIVDHKPNQYVRLRANKNYWGGPPKADEIVFLAYKSSDAAVQALRGGEVDLVSGLTSAQFASLKGAKGIVAHRGQGRRLYELAMNPGAATVDDEPIGDGHPALKDIRVRRAIHRAIDKQALVDKVLGGYGEVGAGYVPPLFKDYHWRPGPGERIDFDLAAANRELDAAGYRRGPDGIRRMPAGGGDGSIGGATEAPDAADASARTSGAATDRGAAGRPLRLRLAAHASRPEDARLAEYLKGWLKQVGIAVDVQVMEDNKLNESVAAGNYDLQLGGWSVNADPDYIFSIQTCGQRPKASGTGGTTDNFACDPEYDALYRQQTTTLDPATRMKLAKRLQARFYSRHTSVVLYYLNALEAYNGDRFRYFQPMPDPGGQIYGQDGYWSFLTATPGEAAPPRQSPARWFVGAGLAAVLLAGVLALIRRRRRHAMLEERE